MNHAKLAAICALVVLAAYPASAETHGGISGVMALKQLMDGNDRYQTQLKHPAQTPARRMEVAKGQHPIAIILGCSDSRVPPELVFDQGLGDLFVVRVAGNISDPAVLGSIEYAAEHLGASLVMVLGHERCGAVSAAVQGGTVPGHIGSLVEAIQPAVLDTKGMAGDSVDNAVRANVKRVADELRESKPILAHMIHEKKLKVIGARYDLDTGEVELLP